ncbi:MAG: hypothetical protein EBZ48_03960 [Proteobacteria bacterium]|nr:hypothetical protein [Pseudomonadota bacterium]
MVLGPWRAAVAQPSSTGVSPCGEWTVCSAPMATATAVPTAAPTVITRLPGERWHLPACTKDDELLCKNNCHGKFAGDYWRCVNDCLAQRCAKAGEGDGPVSEAAAQNTQGCVELASLDCVQECSGSPGAEGSRCRRDCLVSRCREANSLDIAKESASPGALACERCTARIGPECRVMCGSGAWIPPGGVVNGLGGLLCERSCVSVRCGVGCGVGLP